MTEPLFFFSRGRAAIKPTSRTHIPKASAHLPHHSNTRHSASLVDSCDKLSIPKNTRRFIFEMSIPPEIIQVKRLVKKRKAADDDDEGVVDYLRP